MGVWKYGSQPCLPADWRQTNNRRIKNEQLRFFEKNTHLIPSLLNKWHFLSGVWVIFIINPLICCSIISKPLSGVYSGIRTTVFLILQDWRQELPFAC